MSQSFPRLLDLLSGERSAGAGEGLESTIEHTWLWPPWMTLLLLLFAAAFVVVIYIHERGQAGRAARALLAGLRITLIGLVVLMMYGWMRHRHRTDLPDVAVVIDDSASMSTVDQYDDKQGGAVWPQRVRDAGFDETTRANIAKTLLLERDEWLLKTLAAKYHVRTFAVGDTTRSLATAEPSLAESLRNLQTEGTASRLGKGVLDVLQLQRGRPTAAILLFTDGATTEGKPVSEAAETARRQQVPLFIVGLGNDKVPRDVQLSDLVVDDVAFVNDLLEFNFKVSATGYPAKEVLMRLRREGDTAVLAEETVRLGKDGETRSGRLAYRPREQGEFEFVVEVQPLNGETSLTNNRLSRVVTVSEETIRVLLVQGYPSYEFRYLKTMLGRAVKSGSAGDKAIELKSVLQDADFENAQQDETAERVFPVSREELFRFDVLIFGDCNPSFFGNAVLSNIADFVKERGGGLLVLSGPKFTPIAYRDTPLAELFPIGLDTALLPNPDADLTAAFQPQPTSLGRTTPHLQIADSPPANIQVWRELPDLYWLLEASDLRPGVRVLLEHPTRTGAMGQKLPVVCLQFVGAGKVVFHASDELWRWSRHRDGEQFYARYWGQTIRYLSRSKLLGGNRAAELATDRESYQRDEPVRLRVRFLDDRLAPVQDDGVTVVVEREGSGKRNVQLARDATNRGFFDGTVSNLADGAYRAWLAAPTLDGQPPTARFSVVTPLGEQARLEMDAADLRAAAKTSAGRFYTAASADRLPDDLPRGHQVRIESLPPEPLWNRWPLAALFVILIASEWLLRKRVALL